MILNKTRSHRDRFHVIPGQMGCSGKPDNHVNHHYQIANGINRRGGYQGYASVSYFLGPEMERVPKEARRNLRAFLKQEGYGTDLLKTLSP